MGIGEKLQFQKKLNVKSSNNGKVIIDRKFDHKKFRLLPNFSDKVYMTIKKKSIENNLQLEGMYPIEKKKHRLKTWTYRAATAKSASIGTKMRTQAATTRTQACSSSQ